VSCPTTRCADSPSGDYELQVLYLNHDDLDETIHGLLDECDALRAGACLCEGGAHEPGTDRSR